jgi:hypothetical protein
MGLRDIPEIYKHCTVAILEKEGWPVTKANIARAMDIAVSQLERYGYLRSGSRTGRLADIKLAAGKAPRREAMHRREGARGRRQSGKFDRWVRALLPDLVDAEKKRAAARALQPGRATDRPQTFGVKKGDT